MSYGPLSKCWKCKTPLDLNDLGNGGYCGGHYCLLHPVRQSGPVQLLRKSDKKYADGLNRKQRRAAARKARVR